MVAEEVAEPYSRKVGYSLPSIKIMMLTIEYLPWKSMIAIAT